MNTLRVLYHLMRADFFERARRYSSLITIGLTIYIAYLYLPPSDADHLGFSLGGIRGVYNSAWIGSIMAILCSTLLILPGFYLVKDAITRDMSTRVGEIIATTPISKWRYAAGKTLSNFVYILSGRRARSTRTSDLDSEPLPPVQRDCNTLATPNRFNQKNTSLILREALEGFGGMPWRWAFLPHF